MAYQFSASGVKPDLVVVAVVVWSVVQGLPEGLAWAVIGGVMLGLFSGYPMLPVMPLVLVAGLAALGARGWRRYRIFAALLFVPLATIVYDAATLGILQLFDVPVGWVALFQQRVLPTAPLNMAVALVLVPTVLLAA